MRQFRRCAFVFALVWTLIPEVLNAATASSQDPAQRRRAAMELADTSLPPLHLKSHIVNVEIHGRVAKVVSESVYVNETNRELEATYVFPLPQGATVEKFIMWMNGEPVEAKVGEKQAARRVYESIVVRKRDPGLIEQVSDGVFQMRIFPVLPGVDQKIRLEYSHVLPVSSNGTVLIFDYPLAVPASSKQDAIAKNFILNVAMELEGPIARVESSTHKIAPRISEENSHRAKASIEEIETSLDRDFSLSITLKGRTSPVSTLTYRAAPAEGATAEDGTLMLLITPELLAGDEVQAKDVIMVMDTSGSMGGEKIVQARAALHACLQRLRPIDRFAIVAFSDDVSTFNNDWSDAKPENIAAAKTFVDNLRDAGSTNIGAAIQRSLQYARQEGRLRQILFATDGCPTIGETDIGKLVNMAALKPEHGAAETRFFTFGIGYDVNTVLLDKIAALSRSERTYVRPEEKIERKVADLCDRIAAPVLTDVSVKFSENLELLSVYPQLSGDLYLGRQAVVMARYKSAGKGTVTIRGKRAGKDVAIEAPLELPEKTAAATSYLQKQWALRKVGFLLDHIRLNGENKELKEEVIRLGTTFAIVTPYTSYLALEKQDQHRYSEINVPPDILAKAEIGDHFETIRPNRPDTQSAFGSPDASTLHSDSGGGVSGLPDDMIGAGDSKVGGGGGWGGGNGEGTGIEAGSGRGSFGIRNGGGRRLMVKRHGGSMGSEIAVDAALRWLSLHQEADGHFDAAKWGGKADGDLAVTSLSLLAMLGAGHSEKVGQYRDHVLRGIAWLKSIQQADGSFGKDAVLNNSQLLATQALAEAAGMSNIPETRAAAQKAIDWIVAQAGDLTQARLFEPSYSGRQFSIVWHVLTLKCAKVSGLKVGHKAFESVLAFIDGCEVKDGEVSRFRNTPQKDAQPETSATSAALLSRFMLGWRAEELTPSVTKLVDEGGTLSWPLGNTQRSFFTTLSAFQNGGEVWKTWNGTMRPAFIDNQAKDGDNAGSWHVTNDDHVTGLGRAGHTAVGCMFLEVYYRYVKVTGHMPAAPAAPADPAAASAPAAAPPIRNAETGREGVDYSEYIRQLQEGVDPQK